MLTLAHFLQTLTAYQPTGREPSISTVVMDSRQAVAGSLFVAEKGEGNIDGHEFIANAFENGAIAALIEQPIADLNMIDFRQPNPIIPDNLNTPVCLLVENSVTALQEAATAWYKKYNTKIIGITGSVGKTSTKELAHSVLSTRFNTFKSAGNRNSILGLPLTIFELRSFHEIAVLEMAMYTKGEIARLTDLFPPTIGVVTLIGAVHMERAGSMEAIVAAKQELIDALPDDGIAILNKDDARVMGMADHTNARIFTYGLDPNADLWADNIQSMGLDGVRFTLHHNRDGHHNRGGHHQNEALSLHVPLLGRHSVHTSLRAAAIGLNMGLSWEEIATGLRQNPAQLRLVTAPGPKGSMIIDDTYNANPESMMAALNLLADMKGRRIAVLGDMLELGYVEEESHRLIGRRAADVAQLIIAVGSRGRWIGEEALRVGVAAENVIIVEDCETAVSHLTPLIQANDVILVKGSLGMRMDKIVSALGRYD